MPKAPPHFDADALLSHVHAQDYGLHVSTNDPAGFRRIVYKAAKALGKKVHIYQAAKSARRFILLKSKVDGIAELSEETLDAEEKEAGDGESPSN